MALGSTSSRRIVAGNAAERLRNDAGGAATVEFALVSLPFFAILLASLMTALVFFSQQAIETATEAAARVLLTGEVQTARMSQEQFKSKACEGLPVYLSCDNLLVDVSKATSFSTARTAFPAITFDSAGRASGSFSYDVGAAGDIVVVRLMYVWPLPSVSLGYNLGNLPGGKRLLIGTAVSKTELYR